MFFWTDLWCSDLPFNVSSPRLFQMAVFFYHWDSATCSWNLLLRGQYKEDQISDFQQLLCSVEGKKVSQAPNSKQWSLDASRKYTVKSLTKHLTKHLPLQKSYFKLFGNPGAPKYSIL